MIRDEDGVDEYGHTCDCPIGRVGQFSFVFFTVVCVDLNECEKPEDNKCDISTSSCVDLTDGEGYSCPCLAGYSGDGGNIETDAGCVDDDECAVSGACDAGFGCVNTAGSFECNDINECDVAEACGAGGTCSNTDGSFTCTCDSGFELNDGVCQDVNECDTGSACSAGYDCTNNAGSFTCECPEGSFGDHSNGDSCQDVDECSQSFNPCGDGATCDNRVGGFACVCNTGFDANSDQAWTGTELVCTMSTCGIAGCTANRLTGEVTCSESRTFVSMPACEDLDECSDDSTNTCGDNSVCVNQLKTDDFPFGYTCDCTLAGTVAGTDGDGAPICENINECLVTCSRIETPDCNVCFDTEDCLDASPFFGSVESENTKFTCTCKTGYSFAVDMTVSPPARVCNDIDECTSGAHLCGEHAECTNFTPESVGFTEGPFYTCECPAGYEEDDSINNGRLNCRDIDECATATDNCDGSTATCENKIVHDDAALFICHCQDGYEALALGGSGDQVCQDINECNGDHTCDSGSVDAEFMITSVCENLVGTYQCNCVEGFETPDILAFTEGDQTCENIDECDVGLCQAECSDCICTDNVPTVADGSLFDCSCAAGYTKTLRDSPVGDETEYFCKDDNECEGEGSGHNCHIKATCTNNAGSFDCACNSGYEDAEDSVDTGRACIDIDECTIQTHDCDVNAACANSDGGFACSCNNGWTGDGTSCIDYEECTEMLANNVLHTGVWPMMMMRSFARTAYTFQNCHEYAFCTESEGAYTCECLPGMKGDGFECTDILECSNDEAGSHDCHADAECTEELGYFTCACSDGYYGDGKNCRDIDECTETADTLSEFMDITGLDNILHTCDSNNGICTNMVTSTDGIPFDCQCKDGSEDSFGDGSVCDDINECEEGLDTCGTFTTCENNNLSFQCHCIDGGFGKIALADGTIECFDLDECDMGSDDCDETHGICANNDGGFTCTCPTGFEDTNGDGTACRDLDECAGEGEGHGICGDGTECENSIGAFDCVCMAGYDTKAVNSDGQFVCADINECDAGTDDCGTDGFCINNVGGFSCECSVGFVGDGYVCTDVDECEGEGLGNDCDSAPRAGCTNTHGGFECACLAGYEDVDEVAATGTACQLEIDCNVDNGGCSHLCYIPTGCACPGTCWTIGDDELTCEPSSEAVSLNCSSNAMEISIDACLFDNEHYAINFLDNSCTGSGSIAEGGFVISTTLDECDTQLGFVDGKAVFTQTVFANAIIDNIYVGRPSELEFTCSYDTELDTNTEHIVVHEIDAQVGLDKDGSFEFSIGFYRDNTFAQETDENDLVVVGETMFFAVKTEDLPASLDYMLHTCLVTDESIDASYPIIFDGCSDVITETTQFNVTLDDGISTSGVSYRSFAFSASELKDHEETLSCKVLVCDKSDATSACATEPTCVDRRRRSISDGEVNDL